MSGESSTGHSMPPTLKRTSPCERGLVLILASVSLWAYLFGPLMWARGFWDDLEAPLVLLTAGLIVTSLTWALYAALGLVGRGRHKDLELTTAVMGMTFLGGADTVTYRVFGQHLDAEALDLILASVTTGEFELDAQLVVPIALRLLGMAAAVYALLRLLCYVPRPAAIDAFFSRRPLAPGLLVVASSVAMVGVVHLLPSLGHHGERVQRAMPWGPLRAPPPMVLDAGAVPVKVTANTERDLLEDLKRWHPDGVQGVQAQSKPDILLVHLESLRSSMLAPDTMPFLTELSQTRCQTSPRHYSTGTNTSGGINGLLNGLSAFYHMQVKREGLPSVPVSVLRSLGYRTGVYFTKSLKYDNTFDDYFATMDHVVQTPKSTREAEDIEMVRLYLADPVHGGTGTPRMDYMIVYSSHYDYYYPAEFERHTPALELGFEITSSNSDHVEQSRDQLYNRYKNAGLFVDDLMRQLIEGLEAQGRLDNTIVVMTGDHGEEFWEHGRFGHTFGLSNVQTQVVMVACFPERVPLRYTYTSHADVMPTIFDAMGVDIDVGRFTTGKSWYDYDPDLDHAVTARTSVKGRKVYKYVVSGDGLRVEFRNRGLLRATRITDADDEVLRNYDGDAVVRLLNRAVMDKEFSADAP